MSQWMYRLGSIHQYSGVDYTNIAQDGDVRCLLCDTGWMSRRQRIQHFHGSKHAKKYRQVIKIQEEHTRLAQEQTEQKDRSDRVLCMQALDLRVGKLGLQAWRNTVRATMFDYCQSRCDMAYVTTVLKQHELKETASLLELAIWKAHIIGNGVIFQSVADMREYQILDEDFDPRQFAAKLLLKSGAEVIIPNVLAFLHE